MARSLESIQQQTITPGHISAYFFSYPLDREQAHAAAAAAVDTKSRGMAERELTVLLLFALLLPRHRLTIRVSCGMRFFLLLLLLLLLLAAAAVLMCIHVRYLAYWLLCAQYQCTTTTTQVLFSISTRLDSTTIRGGPWSNEFLTFSIHFILSTDHFECRTSILVFFLFLPWWRFPSSSSSSSSSFLVK